MATEVTPKTMTATERRELRGILDDRFAMLRNELAAFAKTAKQQRYDEIRDAHANELADARRRLRALQARGRKLNADVQAFRSECAADEIKVGGHYPPVEVDFHADTITTPKIEAAYSAAEQEIDAALNEGIRRLERERLQLREKLALDALTSGTAREFLSALPQVGELFEVKAIAR